MNQLCGFRLHTVGIVVGWVGAVASFIALVILSVCLTNLDTIVESIMERVNDPKADKENIHLVVLVVLLFYLIINAINLCASSLLIAGTLKDRHLMLIPWLINSGISLTLALLSTIGVTIMAIYSAGNNAFIPVIVSFLSLFLQFTIWSAIYSLYKKIQGARDEQRRLLPNAANMRGYPSYTKI